MLVDQLNECSKLLIPEQDRIPYLWSNHGLSSKPSRVKVNGKAGYIHAMTSQDWAVTVLASAGGPQEVRDLGAVDSKDERGLHHLQCS